MLLEIFPPREGVPLVFFAVALAPGGNVEAAFRDWVRSSTSASRLAEGRAEPEFCLERGLPLGAYLGFFSGRRPKGMAGAFKAGADALFSTLPPSLHFEIPAEKDGALHLMPREELSEAMKPPPLALRAGFFAGKAVTPAPTGRFSCRHFDAVLLRIAVSGQGLAWTEIARAPRLVGPRGTRGED